MWHMSLPWWEFLVRAAVVYVFILVLLRLGGKRAIGQMGAGEFVAILLVSNAVQNSMNGGDNSISGGLILSTVIIGLSVFLAYITYYSKTAEKVIEGVPVILVRHGEVIHKNLRRVLLNEYELHHALRIQGVRHIRDVSLAILESDGKISVTLNTTNHTGQ